MEVGVEAWAEASRDAGSAPKEALGMIDITESSSFTKSMYNEVSMLHHETFLRYQDELIQLEAEAKELARKRDTYKRLSEQRVGEAKGFRGELDAARMNMPTWLNSQNLQVKQKIDRIDQLRAEMSTIKVEAKESKGKMDHLASEKETSRAQLVSAEAQLRATKEKTETQSQKIEELQSQLNSVVADRETLAEELKASKSVAEITKADADEMVAQYRDDAEAARDRLKDVVEYVKWQS
nr:plasminogen-binding group A streptococcal M-like protein PAM [Nicotiana tomentosiformis]